MNRLLKSVSLITLGCFILMLVHPLIVQAQSNAVHWIHDYKMGPSYWQGLRLGTYYNYQYGIWLNRYSPNRFPLVLQNHFSQITRRSVYSYDHTNKDINSLTGVPSVWYSLTMSGAKNPILVGHGMGGLVARSLAKKAPSRVGGVITVGTPNRGAPIVASYHNGQVDRVYQDMRSKVIVNPSIFLLAVGSWALAKGIPALDKTFKNHLSSRLPPKSDPAGNDMKPGSDFLTKLNQHNSTKRVVAIYGNASSPTAWRMASSSSNYENLSNLDDYSVVRTVNEIQKMFNTYFLLCLSISVLKTSGHYTGTATGSAVYYTLAATTFSLGEVYLRNTFPNQWNSLIGSSHIEYTTYTYREWIPPRRVRNWYTNGGYWAYTTRRVPRTVSDPNNGLLGTWHQQFDKQFRGLSVFGANHLRMNKHSSMKNVLITAMMALGVN